MHWGSLAMLGNKNKKEKVTESHFLRERIPLNENGTCWIEPNLSNKKEI